MQANFNHVWCALSRKWTKAQPDLAEFGGQHAEVTAEMLPRVNAEHAVEPFSSFCPAPYLAETASGGEISDGAYSGEHVGAFVQHMSYMLPQVGFRGSVYLQAATRQTFVPSRRLVQAAPVLVRIRARNGPLHRRSSLTRTGASCMVRCDGSTAPACLGVWSADWAQKGELARIRTRLGAIHVARRSGVDSGGPKAPGRPFSRDRAQKGGGARGASREAGAALEAIWSGLGTELGTICGRSGGDLGGLEAGLTSGAPQAAGAPRV